jgi:predicted alpha/beta hydrolase
MPETDPNSPNQSAGRNLAETATHLAGKADQGEMPGLGSASIAFNTADGNSGIIEVSYPLSGKATAIVLCLPAMGMTADYYRPLASHLAQQNFIAARTDLRGHGSSSVRPNRHNQFGYYQQIEYDIPQVIRAL